MTQTEGPSTGSATGPDSTVPTAEAPAAKAPRAKGSSAMRTAARSGARLGLLTGTLQQVLSVVATFVLVRILSPADIGLASLATLIVGFAGLFTAAGFGQIIVKRAEVSQRDASSVFWAATVFGVIVSGAIAVLAVPLATVSGHRDAASLIVILAPTMLLGLMASVPRGLLQRRMQFARMYSADLTAMVVYVVVQIVLAEAGAGARSIAIGQLASSTVVLTISAAAARWLPHFTFDARIVREEARFSGGTLANTVTTYVVKNADNWVVSRTSSASALGAYYVAYVLPNILRQRLTWMATDVLMPIFARLIHDPQRSVRAYREALSLHVFVGFPAMAGLCVLAQRIVAVCFGPHWAAVTAPMRLLALAALVEFVTQASTTVFIAHGIPGRNAYIKLSSLAVLLTGLGLTYRHGLVAVASCVVAASATGAVISQVLVRRVLPLRVSDVVAAILPLSIATAGMSAVLFALNVALHGWPNLLALLVLSPIGIGSYLLIARLVAPTTTKALLRETLAILIPRRRAQLAKARS